MFPSDSNRQSYQAPMQPAPLNWQKDIPQDYQGQTISGPPQYVQPHYAENSSPTVLAELSAPLPPAPPTSTSEEQLKEDARLAQQLHRLDVEEVKRRSSSNAGQRPRAFSAALSNEPPSPRPESVSHLHRSSLHAAQAPAPLTAANLDPTPIPVSPDDLPEVVAGPTPVPNYFVQAPMYSYPIPVNVDHNLRSPPSQPLDPASLAGYLERHLQVPYPSQWVLPEVISRFYAYQGRKEEAGSSWLDSYDSFEWRTVRRSENARNPTPPSYTFKFKETGGSFRSPKFTWTMICPEETVEPSKKLTRIQHPTWTYELKLDHQTRVRKFEALHHGHAKSILTTYVHALNYDSLRFIGPDGRGYMWVSSTPLSTLKGSRYDTVRHTLFAATRHNLDPLYGEIVADHTYWDGHIDESEVHVGITCGKCKMSPITGSRWKCKICTDHDLCNACHMQSMNGHIGDSITSSCDFTLVNLPDEALYIRSPQVNPALVIATLQVLKDWEIHTMREEKFKHAAQFAAAEDTARKADLGIMSHWKASDWDQKNVETDKFGTMIKEKSIVRSYGQTAAALGKMGESASSNPKRMSTIKLKR